ncbi:MAG: hypothetical protein M1812_004473 [Candelaria pacifica]|nr:MAG: hypothetical protein M1812_004473 [Candelaria pacifica]
MVYVKTLLSILSALGALLIAREAGYELNVYTWDTLPFTAPDFSTAACIAAPWTCGRYHNNASHLVNTSVPTPSAEEYEDVVSEAVRPNDIYAQANISDTPAFLYFPKADKNVDFEKFTSITTLIWRHISHVVFSAWAELRASIDWARLVHHLLRTCKDVAKAEHVRRHLLQHPSTVTLSCFIEPTWELFRLFSSLTFRGIGYWLGSVSSAVTRVFDTNGDIDLGYLLSMWVFPSIVALAVNFARLQFRDFRLRHEYARRRAQAAHKQELEDVSKAHEKILEHTHEVTTEMFLSDIDDMGEEHKRVLGEVERERDQSVQDLREQLLETDRDSHDKLIAWKAKTREDKATIGRLEAEIEQRRQAYDTLEEGTSEACNRLRFELSQAEQQIVTDLKYEEGLILTIKAQDIDRDQSRRARDQLLAKKDEEIERLNEVERVSRITKGALLTSQQKLAVLRSLFRIAVASNRQKELTRAPIGLGGHSVTTASGEQPSYPAIKSKVTRNRELATQIKLLDLYWANGIRYSYTSAPWVVFPWTYKVESDQPSDLTEDDDDGSTGENGQAEETEDDEWEDVDEEDPEDIDEEIDEEDPEDINEEIDEEDPENLVEDYPEDIEEEDLDSLFEDYPEDIDEEAPEDIDEEAQEDLEDIDEEAPENIDEEAPKEINEGDPEGIDEEAPEDIDDEAPADIDQKAPEDIDEEAPKEINEGDPENVVEENSEGVNEEDPEDVVGEGPEDFAEDDPAYFAEDDPAYFAEEDLENVVKEDDENVVEENPENVEKDPENVEENPEGVNEEGAEGLVEEDPEDIIEEGPEDFAEDDPAYFAEEGLGDFTEEDPKDVAEEDLKNGDEEDPEDIVEEGPEDFAANDHPTSKVHVEGSTGVGQPEPEEALQEPDAPFRFSKGAADGTRESSHGFGHDDKPPHKDRLEDSTDANRLELEETVGEPDAPSRNPRGAADGPQEFESAKADNVPSDPKNLDGNTIDPKEPPSINFGPSTISFEPAAITFEPAANSQAAVTPRTRNRPHTRGSRGKGGKKKSSKAGEGEPRADEANGQKSAPIPCQDYSDEKQEGDATTGPDEAPDVSLPAVPAASSHFAPAVSDFAFPFTSDLSGAVPAVRYFGAADVSQAGGRDQDKPTTQAEDEVPGSEPKDEVPPDRRIKPYRTSRGKGKKKARGEASQREWGATETGVQKPDMPNGGDETIHGGENAQEGNATGSETKGQAYWDGLEAASPSHARDAAAAAVTVPGRPSIFTHPTLQTPTIPPRPSTSVAVPETFSFGRNSSTFGSTPIDTSIKDFGNWFNVKKSAEPANSTGPPVSLIFGAKPANSPVTPVSSIFAAKPANSTGTPVSSIFGATKLPEAYEFSWQPASSVLPKTFDFTHRAPALGSSPLEPSLEGSVKVEASANSKDSRKIKKTTLTNPLRSRRPPTIASQPMSRSLPIADAEEAKRPTNGWETKFNVEIGLNAFSSAFEFHKRGTAQDMNSLGPNKQPKSSGPAVGVMPKESSNSEDQFEFASVVGNSVEQTTSFWTQASFEGPRMPDTDTQATYPRPFRPRDGGIFARKQLGGKQMILLKKQMQKKAAEQASPSPIAKAKVQGWQKKKGGKKVAKREAESRAETAKKAEREKQEAEERQKKAEQKRNPQGDGLFEADDRGGKRREDRGEDDEDAAWAPIPPKV